MPESVCARERQVLLPPAQQQRTPYPEWAALRTCSVVMFISCVSGKRSRTTCAPATSSSLRPGMMKPDFSCGSAGNAAAGAEAEAAEITGSGTCLPPGGCACGG